MSNASVTLLTVTSLEMNVIMLFLLLTSILGQALSSTGHCLFGLPSGVSDARLGDVCYAFFTTGEYKVQYREARRKCEFYGGKLAMPKTKDINTFLSGQLDILDVDEKAWIGLNDMRLENVFEWEDGTLLRSQDFDAFGKNEGPRDGLIQHSLEDCVALGADGFWSDYRCNFRLFLNKEKFFICEFRIITTRPPTTRTASTTTTTTMPTTETTTMPTTEPTTPKMPTTETTTPKMSTPMETTTEPKP